MNTTLEIPTASGDGEGKVVVQYNEKTVDIEWSCGGHYVFTKEYLRRAVENFEATQVVPDVFYFDTADSSRSAFYAKLVSGRFEADQRIFQTATGVKWDDFKAALMEATSTPPKKSRRKGILRKKS